MKNQPNRLEPGSHPFGGTAIDRTRPITFALNGRTIHCFEGDTVLSAALASGIDTAGRLSGATLGLTPRQAPAVARVSDKTGWLPMDRLPAFDRAEYVTPGFRKRSLFRLSAASRRSLDLHLDQPAASATPWSTQPVERGMQADLLVVGGGVAGLSAALAGAKRGLSTVLVDAGHELGGRARLFGTQDGEEAPAETIRRVAAEVEASAAIKVIRQAEVFAIQPGAVRLHQVVAENGKAAGQVIDIHAPRIVLATGALERLPIFSGNRLPGVWGAMDSFELARLYGVWPGKSALIATTSNPVYRLAMFAQDAGIAVPRILDPRLHPQSRFIEFSKAYGITLAPGSIVGRAAPDSRGSGLQVSTKGAITGARAGEPLNVDRLVVSGGWQPDLTLWHMAGGQSMWNASQHRLEPGGGPSGIVLAGSAAGWLGRKACVSSGSDAVDALLNRARRPITDVVIDPIYETPDAPAWIGDQSGDIACPAFLDAGSDNVVRTSQRRLFSPSRSDWSILDTPQPLALGDIAAAVQLGAIPPRSAGIVAQERVAMVHMGDPPTNNPLAGSAPLPIPPAFLAGRYPEAALWLAETDAARTLETGALIFASDDRADAHQAIGVVVRIVDGRAVALAVGTAGMAITVREGQQAIAAKLAAPYSPSGTALGSGTSTA